MGSAAVLAMSKDIDSPEPLGRKPVHPFFVPGRVALPAASEASIDDNPAGDGDSLIRPVDIEVNEAPEVNEAFNPPIDTSGKSSDVTFTAADETITDMTPSDETFDTSGSRRNKRRKVDHNQDGDVGQKRPAKKRGQVSAGGGILNHLIKLGTTNGAAANGRHGETKNAETSLHESTPEPDVSTYPDQQDGLQAQNIATGRSLNTLSANENNSRPHSQILNTVAEAGPTKPRKVLQFNPKTGTIGSPPRPKKKQNTGEKGPSQQGKKQESEIVVVNYGTDAESRVRIGEKMNAILSPSLPSSVPAPRSPPPSGTKEAHAPKAAKVSSPKRPNKATHPFFLGKAKKSNEAPSEEAKTAKVDPPVRTKQFTSNPWNHSSPKKDHGVSSSVRLPQFGVKNSGLKFAGSKVAAWPWKDIVHIRGDVPTVTDAVEIAPLLPLRKSKGRMVKVSVSESVVQLAIQALDIPTIVEAVRNVDTDDFLPPPPELRLPQKHFESGKKLQARILPQLEIFHPPLATKKLVQRKQTASTQNSELHPPPQLVHLFDSISSGLSAFDRSQCETANWAQKYAPTCAIEVLQNGREAFLMRDWLQALMVQSVDTGETEKAKSGAKGKATGPGKKKRRKKLDGFVVSSEDEEYELLEPSDEEADWTPSGIRGVVKKTVVRSGDLSRPKDGAKIANTLVISGPHGCGKTAAVYAVAKELGFEVFEINASSRRSGKDVMEKIGDMTRNHLVQQHQSPLPDGQELSAAEDEVAKDLKSGKQSTMVSFFKPKAVAKPVKKSAKVTSPKEQNESKKELSKNQRQSLILLEEVDILYEEDKQFWATVTNLIVQSKRPFVMTCNDETLLPLHTLRLHGIFRLNPPPRELAVDRLILVAANEGHALTRQAVETLYESRHQDLRATTMDLQYWCQMGVGDRRGGFDWFYPRWPKGIDLDENQDVVRVVSQDTYSPGMNWLGRDSIIESKVHSRLIEEDLLHQSWESWGLDIGHWQDSDGFSSWATGVESVAVTPQSRLKALEAFDGFAEAMSMADICARGSFAASEQESLDATLPEPPAKSRDDCTLGLAYLDAPFATHYDSLPILMASTMKSLARISLQADTQILHDSLTTQLEPLSECRVIDHIQNSFTSLPPGTPAISRIDIAFAFDPIAASDSPAPQAVSYLDPSVFDRTFKLITLDVAPYVRSIVAYDSHLQKQRLKLSSLVSEGGRAGQGSKRMRTTRAALSALEGGSRSTIRGERWFKAGINPHLVMKTAGEGWASPVAEETDSSDSPAQAQHITSSSSSPVSSPAGPPIDPPKKAGRRGRPRKKVVEDDSADELGDAGLQS
ncbi:hypothetical protein B0H67DRAFT_353635 [Lasiosphaeris hirsuta]|uniref:AAA+ ATPase domain-containing protein n=1 Tax=Lasiosphaeris hirsuta TaxID=260670 RepID=A0AA39ZVR9_9PEZI|nr:hypothetical protein B0H67DRAFT_353635 [Lasiosphaeris hirsuta]